MDEIPYWFWMIIVVGLSGMLGLIMYYLAMLLKESTLTMREFRYVVVEFHDVLDSAKVLIERANRISETVETTVSTVSDSVIKPLTAFGTWMKSVKSTVDRFTGEGK